MKQMTQLPIQSLVITDEFGPFSWTGDSTPESVTNIPAWARNTRLLRTESVPTKPWWDGQLTVARRQEWTDGCSRALLFAVGMVIIFGLAILLR